MQISTIGLDIAKNVFQVHGIDAAEKVVVRKRLRRRQMLEFFKALPPSLAILLNANTALHRRVILTCTVRRPGPSPSSATSMPGPATSRGAGPDYSTTMKIRAFRARPEAGVDGVTRPKPPHGLNRKPTHGDSDRARHEPASNQRPGNKGSCRSRMLQSRRSRSGRGGNGSARTANFHRHCRVRQRCRLALHGVVRPCQPPLVRAGR